MRLVACSQCHTQYDVSDVAAAAITCRCGSEIENRQHDAIEAKIHRCGSCGAIVAGDAEDCGYCGSAIVRDPAELSLICPECYARCPEAARFCTACGVGFQPEEIRVEGHEVACPICEALMPSHQVGGLALNECGKCHGLWVPGDGFDALVRRAMDAHRNGGETGDPAVEPRVTGANPVTQEIAYRRCPECQTHMLRRNFRKSSGVIIDTCHEHGTWLDADELEQIAGFLLSGGGPSPTFDPLPSAAERRAKAEFVRIHASHTPIRVDPERGGAVGALAQLLARILA